LEILVLILAPLGDTLFTTPALKALRNGYPEARIDVVAWEENKEILDGNRNIDDLIVCRGKGQLLVELQKIREISYDLSIGLSTLGSFLSYLVNARKKIGFKGEELGWIYDFNVPDNRNRHAVEYCLEIIKQVGGIPDPEPVMELNIDFRHKSSMEEKVANLSLSLNKPFLAIHPGGKYFSFKRWPQESFKELVKIIDQKYNIQVALVGGKDDRELARAIIDHDYQYNSDPVDLTGLLQIRETVALLERADLFIGNDSFPMHLAAVAGIPVIGLFGPTNPINFYPYGTEHKIVRSEYSCSPCFSWLGQLKQYLPEILPDWAHKCKGDCMQAIAPQDVAKAMETMLEEVRVTKLI
jgi:lipopolysaccharide heptosyltransferase II